MYYYKNNIKDNFDFDRVAYSEIKEEENGKKMNKKRYLYECNARAIKINK